ncbi:MAG TPA: glycosyltransferase [Bryobacterales bacterium]|nr:glycosyltransferase [Bryobacterales bacterium]
MLGSLDRGGVETWLLDLLTRLDRAEWQFDFSTLGPTCGRYAAVARARGCQVIPCPLGGLSGVSSFAWRLYRILRRGGYQLVHSHVHHFSGLVLAVARAAGVPGRVAHSHNTHDGEGAGWRRRLYRTAAGVALGSTATLDLACSSEAARGLFGFRPAGDCPVHIVPYGLGEAFTAGAEDGNPHHDGALRRSLGLAEGTVVAGHVGRFERQKNHDFLLRVAAAAKSARPPLRWLLVGDGARRPEMERQAAGLGLDGLVVFCGRREDVSRLMWEAMDVFVLPSLHEGLPLVLLEAQAAGLRSLVSAVVTREAVVMPDAVEYLPLAASPDAWAERLAALAARGRSSASEARRRLAARGFTIEASLAALLGAYSAALERPAKAPAGAPPRMEKCC